MTNRNISFSNLPGNPGIPRPVRSLREGWQAEPDAFAPFNPAAGNYWPTNDNLEYSLMV